jgi:hypothetical protein
VIDIAINREDDAGLVQTEVLNIFLNDLAIQKLKNLHYSYWNGVRYSRDEMQWKLVLVVVMANVLSRLYPH